MANVVNDFLESSIIATVMVEGNVVIPKDRVTEWGATPMVFTGIVIMQGVTLTAFTCIVIVPECPSAVAILCCFKPNRPNHT